MSLYPPSSFQPHRQYSLDSSATWAVVADPAFCPARTDEGRSTIALLWESVLQTLGP